MSTKTNRTPESPNQQPSPSFSTARQHQADANPPSTSKNVMALVGFSLSLAGIMLTLLFSVPGLICSIIGLRQSKDKDSRSFAIAGIVVSIVGIIIWGLLLWLALWLIPKTADSINETVETTLEIIDQLESLGAPQSFNADGNQYFEIITGPADAISDDSVSYQPETPETCQYAVSSINIELDNIDGSEEWWKTYNESNYLTLDRLYRYVVARNCGQWQLISNPIAQ